MTAIVNFAMFPIDGGSSHMGAYVAKVVDALRKEGVDYQLGSMSTTFEVADAAEGLRVVAACHKALEGVSERVYTTLTMDCRRGAELRSANKVKSVNDKIIPDADF